MSNTHHTLPAAESSTTIFRRGLTWLRDSGAAATGKKAKRLLHRRDRHQVRQQLRQISSI